MSRLPVASQLLAPCHCEERSDEAISVELRSGATVTAALRVGAELARDCFVAPLLAMTADQSSISGVGDLVLLAGLDPSQRLLDMRSEHELGRPLTPQRDIVRHRSVGTDGGRYPVGESAAGRVRVHCA